ncbi:MAG: hypothetical protein AB7F21_06335 [Desulfuromonadales bacterium]|uniref:hypothetical protein n=1 Tax=Desulfuromonas sp. KJ2020 TaxID=2919173 RepID=UPI0020A7A44C|nr:hypothetical protein [Desulfuromonas sp. KJ2020]MCP3176476.1 hypothetical protein [Desulfuromonas sp. KJ2020]
MNEHLRRVLLVYGLALLLVLIYVPWCGPSPVDGEGKVWLQYRFLWDPPQRSGWPLRLDVGRMFLEFVSLTAVMAIGVVWLWGDE